MAIDVHAHLYVQAQMAHLAAVAGGGQARASLPGATDSEAHVAERLALMDHAGVTRQLLSPPPLPYPEDAAFGAISARKANDGLAAVARRSPDRFGAFATLPLPHISESLAELERSLDGLGMSGVTLQCACRGQSVVHDRYEPIFEALDRRGAVLFLHPCVNGLCSPLLNEWGLAASAGPLFEDATVAMHLILKRIPHRFPRLKIIVPHFGGALPMMLNRLDDLLPKSAPDLPEAPSVTARRFWYDCVGHGSSAALRCGAETLGSDRLLAGSDFPFSLQYEPYPATIGHIAAAGLDDAQVEAILTGNAERLLASVLAEA